MNSPLKINFCYYGMRETLVTHITNATDLARHLSTNPHRLREYFEYRLNTSARVEGNTLKIKGLLSKTIIDKIVGDFSSQGF